jgi:hypothetical protein
VASDVRVTEEVWTLHDRASILRYLLSCFLQFLLLFRQLKYHVSIHIGSHISLYVISRSILDSFKEDISVLSGDESKHSSLLRWVILIEKKKKKLRIRSIRSLGNRTNSTVFPVV